METKYTPGKWHVFKIYNGKDSWENDSYDVGIYSDTGGAKIATVETWIGKAESIECDANADLIAAAPELLEALKEIAELNTMYPPNYNTMTEAQKREWTHYGKFAVIARAAIAKATGE